MGMITDPVLRRRVDRIRRASTTGVLALAVGGFSMSYGSLHGLALAEGVDPTLAWMWPLIVDGFIVVASLAVLHAVLERRSSAYPWCLVLGFSAISVGFNVLHAAPTPVARLVGAVPPLALVLSFELLMRQVRAALEPSIDPAAITGANAGAVAPARPAVVEDPRPVAAGVLAARSLPGRAAAGEVAPARARSVIAAHRAAGRRLTGALLARELGVSDSYGRRLLRRYATDGVSSS